MNATHQKYNRLENRNIIIVGQQPWDTEIGSNCKNIALEFSKKNRVLYINPPLDRVTKIRSGNTLPVKKRIGVINGEISGIERINTNLYTLYPNCLIESINWIPGNLLFKLFLRINNNRFFNAVQPFITELGFTDVILFNDSDMFRSFYLTDLLEPTTSVYYSRDNMIATAYYAKHGKKIEPEIIAKHDVCVANSEYLREYCAESNPNSTYVGQGCDFDLFDDYMKQKHRPRNYGFGGPIIGYVGVLTSARLDIKLIGDIARKRPEWNIVLVGPEDDDFKSSDLHQLDNIHFQGAKPITELPFYIDSFDVCFNPQAINELTIGNYPRKIDEYLVLGKPTIATATKSMNAFKDYVKLAGSLEDYLDGIAELIISNDPKAVADRKAFARSHSWEKSVAEIYQAIG